MPEISLSPDSLRGVELPALGPFPTVPHGRGVNEPHAWGRNTVDANPQRIRVLDECVTCGLRRSSCYAFSLGRVGEATLHEGAMVGPWGPLRKWTFHYSSGP